MDEKQSHKSTETAGRSVGPRIGLSFGATSDTIAWVGIALGSAMIVFRYFFHSFSGTDHYLTLVEDDFYYYLVTAQHIVSHGVSTFDGITQTNGYHPLWMGVIVLLVRLFGSGPALFASLGVVLSLCFAVTGRNLLRLSQACLSQSPMRIPMVVAGQYFTLRLMLGGMEVAILLPIMTGLLLYVIRTFESRRPVQLIVTGLLFSAAILARLDSILILVLYGMLYLWVWRRNFLERLGALAIVAIGLVPVVAYVLWNRFEFGTFVTVSSLAKQQQLYFAVNWRFLTDLLRTPDGRVGIILIVPGLVAFSFSKEVRRRYDHLPIVLLMIVLPLVFTAVVMLRSSWILFPWYLYSLPLSIMLCGTICGDIVLHWFRDRALRVLIPVVQWALIAGVFLQVDNLIYKLTFDFDVNPGATYQHSKVLAEFCRTHPGGYAMGDKAGLVAYLSGSSVLQLEGLCSDLALIQHIARQDSLLAVLKEHAVRYLIVSTYGPLQRDASGYVVQTPHPQEAGENSPKMTAHLRQEPVFEYIAPTAKQQRFADHKHEPPIDTHTYIFEIGS
jgi:hypothetical protein